MLLSAAALALWLPAIVGWGSVLFFTARRLAAVSASPLNLLYTFFLGCALLATAASLLNFWMPISPGVSLGALATGWLLFVINQRGLRTAVFDVPHRRPKPGPVAAALVGGVLLLGFSSLVAQQPVLLHDAGMYHLQTVKWLTESALPLGLANLDGHFGFNSSWFSTAAILELPFMVGKSSFVVNGTVFLVYGAVLIPILRRGLRHELPLSSWYLVATTPVWLGAGLIQEMTAPSPELPILFLTLLLLFVLLRAIEAWSEAPFGLFISAVLGAFAVTIKLSAAPLLLVPVTILVVWLRQAPTRERWRLARRVLPAALAICAAIGAVWAARGVALSGCLVYPVDLTCSPSLKWAVPRAEVREDALWIHSWARSPGNMDPESVMAGWDWFMPWFRGLIYNNLLIWRNKNAFFRAAAALVVVGALLWLISLRRRRTRLFEHQGPLLAAGGIGIAYLAYWFVMAPDVRFAFGAVGALAALFLCSGLRRFQVVFGIHEARATHGLAVAIILYLLLAAVSFTNSVIIRPPLLLDTWPAIPAPQIQSARPGLQHTDQGIPVYAFTSGTEDRCWDMPLPCTPALEPGLRIEIDSLGHYRAFYPAPR